jgi:hypothetical protein
MFLIFSLEKEDEEGEGWRWEPLSDVMVGIS